MTDDTTVLVDFSSHAPILRWSGHSQATDPLAAEVGAFFARIKVPIDFVPGAEALVSKATPRTLYCAFIQYVRERLRDAHSCERRTDGWLSGARTRAGAWRRPRATTGGRRRNCDGSSAPWRPSPANSRRPAAETARGLS